MESIEFVNAYSRRDPRAVQGPFPLRAGERAVRRRRLPAACGALLAIVSFASARAASAKDPLKVPRKAVLVTTTIEAAPGLSATLTEFFTGDKSEKSGIGLLLGLHRIDGEERTLIASRDLNEESGGFVSRGSLEVVDLDRDGSNEILVTYHHHEKPGMTRVDLDVVRIVGDKLVREWSGPVRVDTTGKDLGLPAADRERYTREIGYLRTAAAQGQKIFFHKEVSVAAGVVFDPPRGLEEEFDLAGSPEGSSKAPSPQTPPR